MVTSVSITVFLTEALVHRLGKQKQIRWRPFDYRPTTAFDLWDVRHVLILFGALLVGPVGAMTSVHVLVVDMEVKKCVTWVFSGYVGSVLAVPLILLLDELSLQFTHERRQQAFWTYAVLIALNLLYVVLRFLNAADTQLGIYLTFPWLLLMTHMFGPAGAYTGCSLTGFVNIFTAAYLDDIDRIFWMHGHVLILVFTCVAFIEVFRQRDEALNNVERIVEERTRRLKRTMTQLVTAEKKALAAFESRTEFMVVLCHELPAPLLQIINLAKSISGVDVDGWVKRVDGVVGKISNASTYITNIINEMLELQEQDPDLSIPPAGNEPKLRSRTSVGHAASCLSTRFANGFVSVVKHLEEGVESLRMPFSEEQFSKMIQRLISYTRSYVLDHHVFLTFYANNNICLIQTSHQGFVSDQTDLLELASPFSTRAGATSSWISDSAAASGLTLSVVRIMVQQVGGRILLKSLVKQHRIVVTVLLPVEGFVLPAGDAVQVAIDRSSPAVASWGQLASRTDFVDPSLSGLASESVLQLFCN
ncbi:hypothetical protein HK102_004848 [Quaeritorhiza haematococci]|nr:hypothetical protein HK102_004848 [Quaeritorhiza haematococci]